MRKFIILSASIAALAVAALAIAVPSMAASTDANGVVTVTKGDIQSKMGWNNGQWDDYLRIHGVAGIGKLISVGSGPAPTAPDGGMWYLNGQTGTVTADWVTDMKAWTPQFSWTPVEQTITPDSDSAKVEPILNAQNKLTGFEVSSTGTVSWTVHTKYPWLYPTAEYQTFERNVTIQWPNTDGVSDIKVNGQPITVTPYVAPTV